MLQAHLEAVERSLLEIARIRANAGHNLHKGTPREAFIAKFLSDHLSDRVAIGSGEIVDHESQPGAIRNQIDIVLYRRDFPRLFLGGDLHAFLVESVVATIEVKSVLDKAGFRQAMSAAKTIKALSPSVTRSLATGYQPPGVLCFAVAYEGPASMDTVCGWLTDVTRELKVEYPELPSDDRRLQIPSPALDAVFILGKGFLQYQNSPIGFTRPELLQQHPQIRWSVADTPSGSLLLLFLQLTIAVSGMSASWLDPNPYLGRFNIAGVKHTSGLPDLSDQLGGQWVVLPET